MKISIIVPVYNKSAYLELLFNDLKNQTLDDYEVILVNDGSTDGSKMMCEIMKMKDSRYKVFHIAKSGVSNARNYGMRQATGKYITFIDADDRLYPEYLYNLYCCITDNDVDLVISGIEKYWISSTHRIYSVIPFKGKINKGDIMPKFAQVQKETGIFGYCVAKIFKKKLVENINFDDQLTLAEDFEFYLKLYRKIETIYFDDKCYYRYLQCADNSTAVVRDEDIDYFAQLIINLRYKNFLIEENSYTGENKCIVDSLINNYIYFVIFYSNKDSIKARFERLQEVIGPDSIHLERKINLKQWILFWTKRNQLNLVKGTLNVYRILRKIVHIKK